MKILVTGGGGFLGSAICRQLAELDHRVVAFQRRPATHLTAEGMRSVEGNIADHAGLLAAADGCGAVMHTAGKAGIWGKPSDFHRVNVGGTAVERSWIEVSVLDASTGEAIAGYADEDCTPLDQDAMALPVRWGDRGTLADVACPAIRLRFNFYGAAKQYSFHFEQAEK